VNTTEPIERALLRFLTRVLNDREYDLIVCGERKATAVMRAMIQEIPEPRLRWPWHKVLSSAAISAFDWGSFRGRNILLFEELVHHGNELRRCHEELRRHAPDGTRIYSGGFAVWQRCEHRPDTWYYAALDDDEFAQRREQIIAFLQHYGSLLLDTEHIEITAKIDCGLRDFFGELARSAEDGDTFAFVSGAKRENVTISNPALLDDSRLSRMLTPGSNAVDVVRKCRVLQARSYDRFSIMPIFYPNTRCVVDSGWLDALPKFVDRDALRDAGPHELFYTAGLLASIELLRGIVAALGDLLRKDKIALEVPEDNFSHLRAMFPNVDVDGMHEYVSAIVLSAKSQKPLRSRSAVEVRYIPEAKVKEFAFDFFEALIDDLMDREDWECTIGTKPKGESFAELKEIAERVASGSHFQLDNVMLEKAISAVAPDRLIDAGMLVTKVEDLLSSRNEKWVIRTFVPDGEVVTVRFQQQMAAGGNPWR